MMIRDERNGAEGGRVSFWCPGCLQPHAVFVGRNGWSWAGGVDRPTLMPSVLVTYTGPDAGQGGAPPARCHSFVEDGRIRFLADSTHALASWTVELPEFPQGVM